MTFALDRSNWDAHLEKYALDYVAQLDPDFYNLIL